MKRNRIGALLLLLLACACAKELKQETTPPEAGPGDGLQVRGRSIVRVDEALSARWEAAGAGILKAEAARMDAVAEDIGITAVRRLFPYDERFEERTRREGLHRWYVVEFDEREPLTRAEAELSAVPGIEAVEPQLRIGPAGGYDDPDFPKQWALCNEITPGVDINVLPAWDSYPAGASGGKQSEVIVAVIDEGIQTDHEDLAGNTFPAGSAGNRNFFDNSSSIRPGDHGTHVAGIIAAVNNNHTGICGIAGGDRKAGRKGVRLLSCEIIRQKTTEGKVETLSAGAAEALKWAADHGAVIAQNSWGYPADQNEDGRVDEEERRQLKQLHEHLPASLTAAIDYFTAYAGCDNAGNQLPESPMKGGLVIFAAGNDNLPYGPPAGYEPVLAVGAIVSDGSKAGFSNYGDWVDLAAPGTGIYSTLAENGYGYLSGTSMACPQVSGVAALVLSRRGGRGYTNAMLREALIKGANAGRLKKGAGIGPLLDAMGALCHGDTGRPSQPAYTVKPVSNSIEFNWKITASPDGVKAYAYLMLAAEDKSLLTNLSGLPRLPAGVSLQQYTVPADKAAGEEASVRMTGLKFDTRYFVRLLAVSYGYGYSGEGAILETATGINHPPRLELPAETIRVRPFEIKIVPLGISDPDGHRLKTAWAALPGQVELSPSEEKENEWLLAIYGNTFPEGRYTMALKITDEYGLAAEEEIPFEVLPNHAPEKLREMDHILTAGSGKQFELTLSDYFRDPDGEQLRLSCAISDKSVLKAQLSYTRLRITTLRDGTAAVTVTATDSRGLKAVATCKVVVRQKEAFMDCYPVPATDTLYIRTGATEADTEVQLRSATGSTVYEGRATCSAFNPLRIDVSGLAPGRYAVKVRYGGKSESRTVTKR